MNADILKTVGQIAGIGGVALGVFLILFREVVRKSIFPQLTKQQGYNAIKLILVLSFIIALAGITAWVLIESKVLSKNRNSNLNFRVSDPETDTIDINIGKTESDTTKINYSKTAKRSDSRIELVDITLDGLDTLDVKFRNKGNISGIIKNAQLIVDKSVITRDCQSHIIIPVSGEYDIDVDSNTHLNLAHEVPPGGVERIKFRAVSSKTGGDEIGYYQLRLKVAIDEDNKTLISEPFTMRVPSVTFSKSTGQINNDDSLCILKRLEVEKEVSKWTTAYSIPKVRLRLLERK